MTRPQSPHAVNAHKPSAQLTTYPVRYDINTGMTKINYSHGEAPFFNLTFTSEKNFIEHEDAGLFDDLIGVILRGNNVKIVSK